MQFCTNGRLNENTLKRIPLPQKPQTPVKPVGPPNQSPASIPATVTSTNPKTPSPLTNDVRIIKISISSINQVNKSIFNRIESFM